MRHQPSRFVIMLVAVAWTVPALAQTPVVDPRFAEFTASADHFATTPEGLPQVTRYDLEFYLVGAAQPFQVAALGKPAPDPTGLISVDLATALVAYPPPGAVYEARISAVGPGGVGRSDLSNQFAFTACVVTIDPTTTFVPAEETTGSVSVTVGAGCAWTATSNAGWLSITSGSSGSGSGTVVYQVAANTSAEPRTGTLTIAGQTFTVTQVAPPAADALLWHHATRGEVWLWQMEGATAKAKAYVRTVPDTDWRIRAFADQTGDGQADITWRHEDSGSIYFWQMNGSRMDEETYVATVDPAYEIAGTGDYNGDGKSDLLWQHRTTGQTWVWLMDGANRLAEAEVATVDPAYKVAGCADLDGDGKADIVWHHSTTGEVWLWRMDGTSPLSQSWVAVVPDVGYQIAGIADYSADLKADILWRHATAGDVWLWTMDGAARLTETWVGTVSDTNYRIAGTGDYTGDGIADIVWHHATAGDVWVWVMNGPTRVSESYVSNVPDTRYQIIK